METWIDQHEQRVCAADDAAAEIARLTRERDEAVRVAVWCAENASRLNASPDGIFWDTPGNATDADIYRALREAMGGAQREGK